MQFSKNLQKQWRFCARVMTFSNSCNLYFFYFTPCTVHLLLFSTVTNKCTIISQIIAPGQHDSNITIQTVHTATTQTVHTATTQTDFIITTK